MSQTAFHFLSSETSDLSRWIPVVGKIKSAGTEHLGYKAYLEGEGSHSAWGKRCEGGRMGQTKPGSCSAPTQPLVRHSSSATSWRSPTAVLVSVDALSRNPEFALKDHRFQTVERVEETSAGGPQNAAEAEVAGSLHSCRLWLYQLKCI